MSNAHIDCPMTVRRRRAVVFYGGSAARDCRGTKLPLDVVGLERPWLSAREGFYRRRAGDLVSWSVDAGGHVFPAHGGAADEPYPHVVIDRAGVEWTVREVQTPQPWARGEHCLVLNSRECVRRLWYYPPNWRTLDADVLLELGIAS